MVVYFIYWLEQKALIWNSYKKKYEYDFDFHMEYFPIYIGKVLASKQFIPERPDVQQQKKNFKIISKKVYFYTPSKPK